MNKNIYEEILELVQRGGRGAIATVIRVKGSSPQVVGAKMLVREDGSIAGTVGGGMMEARAVEKARAIIQSGKPEIITVDLTGKVEGTPVCGGEMDIYIEPLRVMPRILIFGAGHVGTELARIAHICGFRVCIIDDRREWANEERIPHADEIMVSSYEKVFDHLAVSPADYAVIVTRGHEHDQICLERLLNHELTYLGMIGSRKKIARIYKNLRDKGIDESLFKQVHSPIGIAIGASSPAEIAVSIMAEIIQVYRNQTPGEKNCPA